MSRNGDAAVDELLVKRKRGRPRKVPIAPDSALTDGVVAASQGRLSEEGADPGGLGSEDLSTREQRVPAPLSEDVVDAHGNGVIGILTPSKRRGRPKKAVTFGDDEQREIDSQLGFRDIPIERRRSKGSSGAPGHDHGSGPGATLEIRGRTGTTAGIGSDGELPAPKRGSGKRRKHPLPAASPHDQGTPEKRGGRPPKHVSVDVSSHEAGLRRSASSERHEINPVGRPDEDDGQYAIPRKRGRPRKYGLHLDEPHPGEDLAVEDEADEVDEVPPAQQDITNEDGTTNFGALFWRLQRDHALDGMVELIKTTVLEKLTAKRRMRPIGLDEEYRKVHQLVEQTVVAGEGNSMLVIGARGSGKTTLVERVISDISVNHRHDFHVVRLNGFIHTDDKLALREIWRQLGREMDMEEDNAKTSNYADTLSSLLALLSHPAELSGDDADRTAKSVVFVLDEFELFASHPRQTLLYNLFDIAQARKAPVAVLGVTARVNVVESLEKRVKSRFSHRYVHVSLPKSLTAFWETCREAIAVTEEDRGAFDEEGRQLMAADESDLLSTWNSYVEALWGTFPPFQSQIAQIFQRTRSIPDFFTAAYLPIASLTPGTLHLLGQSFARSAQSLSAPDNKLTLLPSLSELELALLIAGARLDVVLDTDACTFAMAYDEYGSLAARARAQSSASGAAAVGARVWGRGVAVGAWERLAACELVVPAIGAAGAGGGEGSGGAGRMWKVDVALEEIAPSVPGMAGVMARWCREI